MINIKKAHIKKKIINKFKMNFNFWKILNKKLKTNKFNKKFIFLINKFKKI